MEEMRPWQKGLPLDLLLKVTAEYEAYNRYSMSPFSQVTKDKVATWLDENRLRNIGLTPNGITIKDPFVSRTIKRDTEVNAYNSGTPIGILMDWDHEITKISRVSKFLIHYIKEKIGGGHCVWIAHWLEDQLTWLELMQHFPNIEMIGNKYSSIGEILRYAIISGPANNQLLPLNRAMSISDIDKATTVRFPVPWDTNVTNERILSNIGHRTFERHYSKMNYGNSWSAISLRGYGPDPSQYQKPSEMKKKWQEEHKNEDRTLQNTPLLKKFPEIKSNHMAFFKSMGCEIQRVRLMKLEPGGGELQRHSDQVDRELGTDVGRVMRMHFPVLTNHKVLFTRWSHDDGKEHQYYMDDNHGWYLDIRKPHRAVNGGDTQRIHLVIDVVATEKLLDFLGTKGKPII